MRRRTDYFGKRPIDIAESNGYHSIAWLLDVGTPLGLALEKPEDRTRRDELIVSLDKAAEEATAAATAAAAAKVERRRQARERRTAVPRPRLASHHRGVCTHRTAADNGLGVRFAQGLTLEDGPLSAAENGEEETEATAHVKPPAPAADSGLLALGGERGGESEPTSRIQSFDTRAFSPFAAVAASSSYDAQGPTHSGSNFDDKGLDQGALRTGEKLLVNALGWMQRAGSLKGLTNRGQQGWNESSRHSWISSDAGDETSRHTWKTFEDLDESRHSIKSRDGLLSVSGEECGICFVDPACVQPADCGHALCVGCAKQMLSSTPAAKEILCPFCRHPVTGFKSAAIDA